MNKFYAHLIPLLLFFNLLSTAQTKTEVYHKYINQAEIHIINHEEFDALKCYTNAFKIQNPFASDVYNALVCAIKVKNDSKAIDFCLDLARKGVGKLFFNKALFQTLNQHSKWPMVLRLAELRKKRLEKKNEQLFKTLNYLLEKDRENALINRTLITNPNIETWNRVIKTTDSISGVILKIYQKTGFLSEERLGVALYSDTSIIPNQKYEVILVHCFQSGSYKYKEKLLMYIRQSLLSGQFNPHGLNIFFNLTSTFDFSLNISRFYLQSDCKLYKKKFSDFETWKIDHFRKDFLLCSLNDYEAKVIYNSLNPNSEFLIVGVPIQSNDVFQNEEDRNFFFSQYKELEIISKNCK